MTGLGPRVAELETALALWAGRGQAAPGAASPRVRRSANTAITAVDAMLAELHQLRNRLVSEVRRDDDAFFAYLNAKYGPVSDNPSEGVA